ncbi:hypothetical protein D3C71_1748520 [compost metagenome]
MQTMAVITRPRDEKQGLIHATSKGFHQGSVLPHQRRPRHAGLAQRIGFQTQPIAFGARFPVHQLVPLQRFDQAMHGGAIQPCPLYQRRDLDAFSMLGSYQTQ